MESVPLTMPDVKIPGLSAKGTGSGRSYKSEMSRSMSFSIDCAEEVSVAREHRDGPA
jgi:hypothetical protein